MVETTCSLCGGIIHWDHDRWIHFDRGEVECSPTDWTEEDEQIWQEYTDACSPDDDPSSERPVRTFSGGRVIP